MLTLFIGPVFWFLFTGFYYSFTWGTLTSDHMGTFLVMMQHPLFWLVTFFTVMFILLPGYDAHTAPSLCLPLPLVKTLWIQDVSILVMIMASLWHAFV